MGAKTLTIRSWEDGDWVEVWDGEELLIANHSISVNELRVILAGLGFLVVDEEVGFSDDEWEQ